MYERCDKTAIGNATYSEFVWAISLTMSRSYVGPNDEFVQIPLADLYNHYENYNTLWKWEEDGTYSFIARDDIAAGEEIRIQYGLKDIDIMFQTYGFVPNDDVHDNIRLLDGIPAENLTVEFFKRHFPQKIQGLGASSSDHTLKWVEYVAEMAGNAVTTANHEQVHRVYTEAAEVGAEEGVDGSRIQGKQEQRRRRRSGRELILRSWGPRFEVDPTQPPRVWYGGGIDPRLLAVTASVWHFLTYDEQPAYDRVAHASLWYGWEYDRNNTCASVAEKAGLSERELASLLAAASAVEAEVLHTLNKFPTTLEEDKEEAEKISECTMQREESGNHADSREGEGDVGSCQKYPEETVDLLNVFKFRILKKELLRDVVDRVSSTCRRPDPLFLQASGTDVM